MRKKTIMPGLVLLPGFMFSRPFVIVCPALMSSHHAALCFSLPSPSVSVLWISTCVPLGLYKAGFSVSEVTLAFSPTMGFYLLMG